ncbi:unnamed protein product [Adineta ricciae]|uniref:DUF952 domain-containing protein n=1 Tax=Adineta ricciae TaxID=249248 RepID=A0A813QNX2_ADIRI|nr:unnamed protein product [Adineta ricciae]
MTLIYHLAPSSRWYSWPAEKPYLPPDYEKDGFIHCTSGDELMLKNPASEVKWEKASEFDSLFPHIYGAMDRDAVVEIRRFQRADDGTFVGWTETN